MPSSIDWQEAKAPKVIRILHVIPGLGLGGAETLLFELVRRQTEFEHSVICLNGPGWFSDKLEELGVRVGHLHMRASPVAAIGLIKLYRIIHREKPDLVQAWLYSANFLAGVAAKLAGVPVIWGIHTCWSKRYRMLTRLFARAGGILAPVLPAQVINCSEAAARTHAELGYPNGPAVVIHNGYDAFRFIPDSDAKATVRRELGIPADRFIVGSITRWTDYKDVPTLLRALRIVAKEGRPVTCVLVGQGLRYENSGLAEVIRQLGCSEYVLPLGRRLDIERVAAALDLHVLPSVTESFGNTIAETMLAGVPNVVTDCGGPAEVVGNTGWVVPTQNPQEMADAISEARREWSEMPEAWERRRSIARARVVENFSAERMARAYGEVWRQVAAKGEVSERPPALVVQDAPPVAKRENSHPLARNATDHSNVAPKDVA